MTIPDSVTSIGDRAFSGCSGLTSVTIPDCVTSIGSEAFRGCIGLTSVTIGNGMTSIEKYAFSGCLGLTSVTIPDSVTSIGYDAFADCSEALYDRTSISGVSLVDGWVVGTTDLLPSVLNLTGSRGVADDAFRGCSGLKSVTIPDSVTSIGTWAFEDCSGLTSVTIGNGVTSIGSYAFYRCSALTSVTIPDGVTSIGTWAFRGCIGLTSVTIPDSVMSIGVQAFSDCIFLTSVTIPDSVTSIGSYAFSYCWGLKELRVPKAWEGTSMLNDVGIPSGCEIIYYEPGESEEAVAVPDEWMDKNAAEILAANGGDYEAAAKAEAANGMQVWECYLAGLSPTDAAAEFKVKSMAFVDGQLVVTWDPDLNDGETKKEREYTLEGAETLGGAWGATNAASRFFRVRVGLP